MRFITIKVNGQPWPDTSKEEGILEIILQLDEAMDKLRAERKQFRSKLDPTWKFRLSEIEAARRVS